MKTYLIDTCIISEFTQKKPNIAVIKKLTENRDFCAISVITYQEILLGIKRLPNGRRRKDLETFFYTYILPNFPVIEYGTFCATIYTDFLSDCEKRGLPRPKADTQIAATAKANALILVTRNVKDFEPFVEHENLMVENWFE